MQWTPFARGLSKEQKMKLALGLISLLPLAIISMAQNSGHEMTINEFHQARKVRIQLDGKALDEFIANKKKIVKIGEQLENHHDNNLLAAYRFCAEYEKDLVKKELEKEEIMKKIEELQDYVWQQPDFKDALANLKENTHEPVAWNCYGAKYINLMLNYLIEKKQISVGNTSVKQTLLENKEISEAEVEYIIAGSVIHYRARQFEREVTGKDLEPLIIQ